MESDKNHVPNHQPVSIETHGDDWGSPILRNHLGYTVSFQTHPYVKSHRTTDGTFRRCTQQIGHAVFNYGLATARTCSAIMAFFGPFTASWIVTA